MAQSFPIARAKFRSSLSLIAAISCIAALPGTASANDNYDTAIACAGGLDYLATMLPPGTEPATDARTRSEMWKTEAQRLSRKSDSAVTADIRTSSAETGAVMMGGDQTKMAAHFGTLNDTCAELPETNAAADNPFDLKYPTKINTYNAAIACTGMYIGKGAAMDNEDAKTRFDRFKAFAQETFPDIPPKKLEENIQKATSDWMMAVLTADDKQLSVSAMCTNAYSKIK